MFSLNYLTGPKKMFEKKIPFNWPYVSKRAFDYINSVASNHKLSGDGIFTEKCHRWLKSNTKCEKSLLTNSCTVALEMAALLLNIQPGDEVIMPSYTFVSTANAFVLRGAIPVFIDIREDTLNINENLIEEAVTPKTRVIVPVHYAGVSCEMDKILAIAKKHNLFVVEDAAQGIIATYKGRALGSIGHIGAYSFHDTKNIISGEGGALLVNDPQFVKRSEILWEKGTNRSQFLRGEIDKYTWQDIGSSFLPSEITAAFLYSQLEEAEQITADRLRTWNHYHQLLAPLEKEGLLRRPTIPPECQHNAHMYYALLNSRFDRTRVINLLNEYGINAVSHYVPLHSSPAGQKYGRPNGDLHITTKLSKRLIRLPLWYEMDNKYPDFTLKKLSAILRKDMTRC